MSQQMDCDYRDRSSFLIDGWTVDPGAHTVVNGSTTHRLEPKAMQVLVHLSNKAGKVVSRNELEASVWSGVVVGYDALSNAIIKIRKAFDDQVRYPRVIETIPKSGYRLIAMVSAASEIPDKMDSGPELKVEAYPIGSNLPLPDLPSIAVLSFKNHAVDKVQEYLCEGLAEDIILDLSKLSGLFVIASNSSFVCDSNNLRQASRDLGVRYLLQGNVRHQQNGIRIYLQLVDGNSGGLIWGERYFLKGDEIFECQDNIRRDIINTLKLRISTFEEKQFERRGTYNTESYHYLLRGRELDRRDNKASNQEARTLLQNAIDCDPKFSAAHSYLSRNLAVCYINRWNEASKASLQSAIDAANRALQLDEYSAHAHFALGASTLWARDHETAIAEAVQAILLAPNFAEGHALQGMIQMYCSKPQDAISSLKTAMRLDPFFRDAYLHIIGQAYFHNQQYSEAVHALKSRLIRKPDSDTSRVLLASTYAHQGRLKESRSEWMRALAVNPDYSIEHKRKILPYKSVADFQHFENGLRKSGIL